MMHITDLPKLAPYGVCLGKSFLRKLKNVLKRYIVVCFLLYFFFLCENPVIILHTFPNKK